MSVPSNSEIRRGLTAARRLLTETGWIKGRFSSPDGYCLTGAMMEAMPTLGEWNPVMVRATARLRQALSFASTGNSTLVGFNDDPWTTREDVLALIDRAIGMCV